MDEAILHKRMGISRAALIEFCTRWQVAELHLFGSVLSESFSDDSDIDLLVSFNDAATWGIFEFVRMREELQNLVGRDIDLFEKVAIERSRNPIRRDAILQSARKIYAA